MRRALCLLAVLLALPLSAAQKQAVTIKEWPIPWPGTQPMSAFPSKPDAVWFTGAKGHYVGTLNPQTGGFKRIDLIDEPGPQGVIVAANSLVWFTGTLRGYIGRYDPVTRRVSHIETPNSAAGDPNQLIFELGERAIWFTVPMGNIVGRVRIDSGVVDLLGVSGHDAHPDGVASAPDGTPWFALAGTNRIARVDWEKFSMKQFPLPRAEARPRRIACSSDGRIWYTDFAEGYLGVFTPASQTTKEWRFPGGKGSRPYGVAVDSLDRVWAVETGSQPSKLMGFDPKTERFFSTTAVPSGGGAISNLRYDRASGQLWFTTEKDTIAAAKVN